MIRAVLIRETNNWQDIGEKLDEVLMYLQNNLGYEILNVTPTKVKPMWGGASDVGYIIVYNRIKEEKENDRPNKTCGHY